MLLNYLVMDAYERFLEIDIMNIMEVNKRKVKLAPRLL